MTTFKCIALVIFICLFAKAEGCPYEKIIAVGENGTVNITISNTGEIQTNVVEDNTEEKNARELHSGLMRKYDTNVIPVRNSDIIDVNITFHLMSLQRFDEREETLITTAWLSIRWTDMFLRWIDNPRYENISRIFLKQKEIWKPDILLINTVEHMKGLGTDNQVVMVRNNGVVVWEPGNQFKTACSLDIKMYPFDHQQCSLKFATWMHVDYTVRLSSVDNKVHFDHFEENGEWEIISSSVKSSIAEFDEYGVPEVSVTLVLQRRRMYYVLTVCVPIIVLSVLNCLVYLLPPASGEKISFCLTILLAYMVYISFLSDNLPRTSKTSSFLVIYLSLMICLSFLSVTNSVIVLLFWHRSDADQTNPDDCKNLQRKFISTGDNGDRKMSYTLCDNKKDSLNVTCDTCQVKTAELGNDKNKAIAKRLDRILLVAMSALTLLITTLVLALLFSS